jgi:hypothetical protein
MTPAEELAAAADKLTEITEQAEYFAVTFEKPQDRAAIVRELTRFGCRLFGLPDPDQSGQPLEPTEFGAIVLARVSIYDDKELWSRSGGGGWNSESGAFVGSYRFLRDITIVQRGAGRH